MVSDFVLSPLPFLVLCQKAYKLRVEIHILQHLNEVKGSYYIETAILSLSVYE